MSTPAVFFGSICMLRNPRFETWIMCNTFNGRWLPRRAVGWSLQHGVVDIVRQPAETCGDTRFQGRPLVSEGCRDDALDWSPETGGREERGKESALKNTIKPLDFPEDDDDVRRWCVSECVFSKIPNTRSSLLSLPLFRSVAFVQQ